MTRQKATSGARKLIWRISKLSPLGEWVDKRVRVAPKAGSPTGTEAHSSWMTSTHDLMTGAEVSERAGCEFDELFGPPPKPVTRQTDK